MADMNRGQDLSVFETTTASESDGFRSFYAEKLGTAHRGLNFWLDVERPDVLKRYRAFADDGTPGGLEAVRKVGGFSFLVSYAMSGYAVGIRYLVRLGRRDQGERAACPGVRHDQGAGLRAAVLADDQHRS